ncbi:hypothetical protein SCAR479_07468 [Seiridium cardinale]|uniref:Uncharacterized protein n=1 Tax=Seiridium cardinale TaxID=138064 RepID=A0ABR2XQ91_9PEZI
MSQIQILPRCITYRAFGVAGSSRLSLKAAHTTILLYIIRFTNGKNSRERLPVTNVPDMYADGVAHESTVSRAVGLVDSATYTAAEAQQLTGAVLANLTALILSKISLFEFGDFSNSSGCEQQLNMVL